MAQKPRNHNEWFRTVSLGGRKSCPCCHQKLLPGESIWSWGEYVGGPSWRTVKYFCKLCFPTEVQEPLIHHAGPCGCTITLVGYQGATLPSWLNLTPACNVQSQPIEIAA
jgi:hypothetical protein